MFKTSTQVPSSSLLPADVRVGSCITSIARSYPRSVHAPGTVPASLPHFSHAFTVPSGSRRVSDRLRSFNFCMGAPSVHISDDGRNIRAAPHSIFLRDQLGGCLRLPERHPA